MSANNRKRKEILENKRQEEEKRIEALQKLFWAYKATHYFCDLSSLWGTSSAG